MNSSGNGTEDRTKATHGKTIPVHSVADLAFFGPSFKPGESPSREVEFWFRVRHASGTPSYKVHGFWDGDGEGGRAGNVFRIRFCPTVRGTWEICETYSNAQELLHQREGEVIRATASDHPGFWEVDRTGPGSRWYRRSDGSHPFIFGNTHYSFLSESRENGQPNGSDIASDVENNARYYRKLRFSICPDRYPHPTVKPFLDSFGQPTDCGDHSHRPNPTWFHNRVDRAVRTAYESDLIADLILGGPDLEDSRSTLRAAENDGDNTPFLRYIAARYGSYPNVWLCLMNEYNLASRTPDFTEEAIRTWGARLRSLLPHPTPVSVHINSSKPWPGELNESRDWNDHVILQSKNRKLPVAADRIVVNHACGGADRPVINDELGYQGDGDGFTAGDVIEGHLGAFVGGGYGSTGYKPGNKVTQYFWGNFDANEHSASRNLRWLQERIEEHIDFWRMAPIHMGSGADIFQGLRYEYRQMGDPGCEYVLATNRSATNIQARLPGGTWAVRRFDVIAQKEVVLSPAAEGDYTFDAPDSRAVLFHFKRARTG